MRLRIQCCHLSLNGPHKGNLKLNPCDPIVNVEGVLMLLQLRSEFQFRFDGSVQKVKLQHLSFRPTLKMPPDRLPVVVRIPVGPLGSLKCDPPKGNGRRPPKILSNIEDGARGFQHTSNPHLGFATESLESGSANIDDSPLQEVKHRQRLLKAPLKPSSYDARFPTARSVKLMNLYGNLTPCVRPPFG